MNRKAIFLTHPGLLKSAVTGGVQLCSQEFHHVIENIPGIILKDYYVPFTRNLWQRVMIRAGLENYSIYNVEKDTPKLLQYIREHNIGVVFLNMASTVRYAKPIKEAFGEKVLTVLLSHGNHSGDFLHHMTKPVKKPSVLRRWLNRLRLGMLMETEASHRVYYLDGVVALSETEKQIEQWFGGRRVAFLPRRLHPEFLDYQPITGRVGFVGRLDHAPNLQGISILLDALKKVDHSNLELRLVGAPVSYGEELQQKYPFIRYLGELPDKTLEEEVATWCLLLNPVWWYSTGASTKLARAISWGVPIITTTAGMRGYKWNEGRLSVADSPEEMAKGMIEIATDPTKTKFWKEQTRLVAVSGLSDLELAEKILYTCQ